MKRLKLAVVLAAVAVMAPAFIASAEALVQYVQLLDGSVLRGEVLSLDEDALVLRTAYAESLSVPRAQIKAILLEAPPAAAPGDKAEKPPTSPATPALQGSGDLEIALVGDAPRSSARYRRRSDRDRMLEMNTLHFKVYVDGKIASQDSDATIEREYSDRGWTFMRNEHQFPPVTLTLPAGPHQILVVVGNELDLMQQGEKQTQLFSADLKVDEVLVRPGEKSRLVISGDGSRFKYGRFELELLSRR